MVGSVDRTSDYDVTIYSEPPHPKIALQIWYLIGVSNKHLTKVRVRYSINLYTHPVYFSVGQYRDYLIKLTDNKFFLNAGPLIFLKMKRYSHNLVHLPLILTPLSHPKRKKYQIRICRKIDPHW